VSDFDGLRIALSSLYAQRKALQVTGQNIADVNTEGSRYHQIEIMQERNRANQLESQNQLSEVEGVDLPAALVDLQLQEVAYQAALDATAKALQPSLMDFLR
jgi:flagellar hook-associated protein 3 FlgL